ncbi:MAG: efflux RND transporter periplasmic adaptor subunit [Gemmataceae bacterium]|nr:efflux RND transporter periplasmic adaptor subunit [Gemmataceae bacterium]
MECNPDLLPRPEAFGWCKQHGVHECPLCHPEVAQTGRRPVVTPADLDRAGRSLAFTERAENSSRCRLHKRRIQYAGPEEVEKAGVVVEPVWTAPVVEAVTGNGEIVYDQTRTARLSARVPGSVFRAFKQVGERAEVGEVVALVDAAEVGRAKAEFLQAFVQRRHRDRLLAMTQGVSGAGAGGRQELLTAEAAAAEARIRLTTAQQALTNLGLPVNPDDLRDVADDQLAGRLHFLGLPKALAGTFDPKTTTGNLLPLTAPFDGLVVTRDVVAGEVVDTTKVLFVVVDPRQVWVNLDLRLEDLTAVALGRPVRFRPDGAGSEAAGTITWVSSEADPKTRTVRVRAVVDNPDGRLRANTFGAGRVILREEKAAVVVPAGAVHWEGCCHVVFVRDRNYLTDGSPKVFHVRTVRVGFRDDKQAEIAAGLLPGEVVAVKGGAALRAELLKNNLGEGCG